MKTKYKNLTISSKFLGNKNWHEMDNDKYPNYNNHIIYIYNTDTKKRCSFEFWNSIVGGEITDEMELLEAFNCFVSDARIGEDSYEDFIHEFGYEDDKSAKSIYKLCCKSLEQFDRVVGLDVCDVLNDLRENYRL